uniref:Uncharacterized protein n=1 Tax=Knipowitschia caucasica TaxID=637954 RepID=A0AAV2LKU4_KNICA
MNNADDLVARGAMGDGVEAKPIAWSITSEGKSSQGTSCTPIGFGVAGQRSCVNNQNCCFPCDGPRGNQQPLSRRGWRTFVSDAGEWWTDVVAALLPPGLMQSSEAAEEWALCLCALQVWRKGI